MEGNKSALCSLYIKPKFSLNRRWTNSKSLWELIGIVFDILLYTGYTDADCKK